MLQMTDMELQDLMFALLGFSLCFGFNFAFYAILLFLNGNVYAVLMYLKVCNFFFHFTGAHCSEFALILRRDFEFELLNNAGIGKTIGTLENGLNAFPVFDGYEPFGALEWNVTG
jgi:hypothetical protein